ncbi:hypothetical protein CQ14_09410 [Bradyrhizobium lablabi]|uniref:Uncharacterized protein n=1 Tax=Bradyrhizobium lablabi TaxID=722472 RepID=A0A0R3MZI8_9BRAD|nr:hypothetical protein [Bradyrhizobium lablabi]KRR25227.1 hypothetical protein CQ14_09410 [Bradyrhizobium lablabi]
MEQACAEACARIRASLVLLAAAIDIFAIPVHAAREGHHDGGGDERADLFRWIDAKPLSLWQDPTFSESAGISDASIIFLGGAWLEEDLLIAALEGVRRGYDVRLLADLSVPRLEIDRSLALDRLAIHGVPAMTLRQRTDAARDPVVACPAFPKLADMNSSVQAANIGHWHAASRSSDAA